MENIWLNPKHSDEESGITKITETILDPTESHSTSTIDSLDQETQEYILAKHPKTNDDTLREDTAQKFLIDSEYLDTLHTNENAGKETQEKIHSRIWEMYNDQVTLSEQIHTYREFNTKVNELLNQLDVLIVREEIDERFPLAISGISNKEATLLVREEVSKIRAELDTIHDEAISDESIGELLKKYKQGHEKYTAVCQIFEAKSPELN